MDIGSIKFVLKKALLSHKFVIKMASLVILLLLLKRSILSPQEVKEFNTGVDDFSARGLLLYMKNSLGKKSTLSKPKLEEKPELNASTDHQDSGATASNTVGETMTDQFQITSMSAGRVTFGGQGTALFNNNIGTNNSFKVGSTTSLGVTAATSSTPEYAVDSYSNLSVAPTTTLSHTIGTRGTTEKLFYSAQLEAARTRARNTATKAAEKKQDEETSSWESTNGATWDKKDDYDEARTAALKKAYDDEYDETFKTEYSKQLMHIKKPEFTRDASSGRIKGIFITKEKGALGNAAQEQLLEEAAAEAANNLVNDEMFPSWDSYRGNTGWEDAHPDDREYENETHWTMQRALLFNKYYEAEKARQGTSGNADREVDSEVIIQGIGSDSSVFTLGDTRFTVDVKQPSGAPAGTSTSTGSGDAGANLATTSFAYQSSSQNANAFMQSFGGSAAAIEEAKKAMHDSDSDSSNDHGNNGGSSNNDGRGDVAANRNWLRTLDSENEENAVTAIAMGEDEEIYIVGLTNGNLEGEQKGGVSDAFLMKLNGGGEIDWTTMIGDPGALDDLTMASDLKIDASKNIYVTGYRGPANQSSTSLYYSAFLMKFNEDGDKLWEKGLSSSPLFNSPYSNNWAPSLIIGPDGNIYVAGSTEGDLGTGTQNLPEGEVRGFVVKVNVTDDAENPSIVWTKIIARGLNAGTGGDDGTTGTHVYALTTDNDQAIYIAGETNGPLENHLEGDGGYRNKGDAYLMKVNVITNPTTPSIDWTRMIASGGKESARALTIMNNYIYVGGRTFGNIDGNDNSEMTNGDAFLTKIDWNGNIQWTNILGTKGGGAVTALTSPPLVNQIYTAAYSFDDLNGNALTTPQDILLVRTEEGGGENIRFLLGTTGIASGLAIENNSVYVTGVTSGNMSGWSTGQTVPGISKGFLAKFTLI